MNKVISVVLSLLIALMLSSCSVETVEEYNSRVLAEQPSCQSSENSVGSRNESDASADSKAETPNDSNSSAKPGTQNSSPHGVSNSANKADSSAKSADSGGTANTPASNGPATPNGSASSNSATSQQQTTITVTISVSCSQIVGSDNLDASVKDLVPSNGVLLSSTSVELAKNSTVYDALKSTCSGKIGYMGGYVYSIFGINEKKCGENSGWKYKVNGASPNAGCNSYTLSDGDVIDWYYTTTLNG